MSCTSHLSSSRVALRTRAQAACRQAGRVAALSPVQARRPASLRWLRCLAWTHFARQSPFAGERASLSVSASRHAGALRLARPGLVLAAAGETGVAGVAGGTAVKSTSMLVVGATGTLGRQVRPVATNPATLCATAFAWTHPSRPQVVRRALDEGYDVRCLVRPRLTPADFLRDWGATTVQVRHPLCPQPSSPTRHPAYRHLSAAPDAARLQGDLNDPSTLPAAMVGVSIVVDCATSKPEEPIRKVDWEAKCALVQCAKAMGIQRYIFFSIDKCHLHRDVPLMDLKFCTEQYLAASGLNYTVLRLTGFMQPLISAYAVPILEEQSVWGTSDTTRTAYLDTQDVARMAMAAVRREAETQGRVLTLSGPRAYTVAEVIELCEKLAKNDAKVTRVPVGLLKATRAVTVAFQWFADAADRLAFAEVLMSNEQFSAPMEETYSLLGLSEADTTTLEAYFQEFFTRILAKARTRLHPTPARRTALTHHALTKTTAQDGRCREQATQPLPLDASGPGCNTPTIATDTCDTTPAPQQFSRAWNGAVYTCHARPEQCVIRSPASKPPLHTSSLRTARHSRHADPRAACAFVAARRSGQPAAGSQLAVRRPPPRLPGGGAGGARRIHEGAQRHRAAPRALP